MMSSALNGTKKQPTDKEEHENIEEAPPLEIKFIVNEPVGDIKVTNASPRDEETKLIEQQD